MPAVAEEARVFARRELVARIRQLVGEPLDGVARTPSEREVLEREVHVPLDGPPREERLRVLLEDDDHLPLWPGDRLAPHDDPAVGWREQAADDLQQGRLAAARRPDDAHELALTDAE